MSNADIKKIAPVIGSGIRVVKNEMLPPNEIMLVVGKDAYEAIKESGQPEKGNE